MISLWAKFQNLKKWQRYGALAGLTLIVVTLAYSLDAPGVRQCITEFDFGQCFLLGQPLWSWLELLGVPLTLAFLGYFLQRRDQKRTEDETKEEVLQAYFDRLSSLLIEQNLLATAAKLYASEEQKNQAQLKFATEVNQANAVSTAEKEKFDAGIDVIRARTLSILRRFKDDPEKKESVIRFLAEAEVISKARLDLSDVDLSGANLCDANLGRANLCDANLTYTNISNINLRHANLRQANLSYSDLSYSDLREANLIGAVLSNSNLSGANFCKADLRYTTVNDADLSYANLGKANLVRANFNRVNLTRANLLGAVLIGADFVGADFSSAFLQYAVLIATDLRHSKNLLPKHLTGKDRPYLCGVALPANITNIDLNCDCDALVQLLVDKYDVKLEEAKAIVKEARSMKWIQKSTKAL